MRVSDDYQYPLTGFVRFSFSDLAPTAVARAFKVVPPGAVVTGGAVVVVTPWNTTGTATLKVGDGDDDDRYTASAINLKAAARTALTLTGHQYVVPTELELLPTLADAGATEGEAFIELTIVMEDRVNEAVT